MEQRSLAGCTLALLFLKAGSAQAPSLRDQRLEDLATLRTAYVERTLALTPESCKRALRLVSELERRVDILSPADFRVGVYEVAAAANNAHDAVWFDGPAGRTALRAPFRMIWFPEALLIARVRGSAAGLAGGRVIEIEGRTPEALFVAMRKLCGGTDAHCRVTLPALIESGGILHSLGLAAAADRLRLKVEMPDGRRVDRTIAMAGGMTVPAPAGGQGRLWAPDPIPGEAAQGWRVAISPASAPLCLREGELPFRTVFLPGENALYVQYRTNADLAGHDIRVFTKSVLAEIQARHPRNLIFDMRFNRGGDITTTAAALRKMPGMISGRTFILIGPYTFSAGIVASAILKKAAGERAMVIGEEPGDRLRFWSEGEGVCLPNSRICLQRTDGMWDLAHGCRNGPHCYGDQFDANAGPLTPQIEAPLTVAAYLSGRDPAMEAVARETYRKHN